VIKIYGPAKSRTFRCLWTLEELQVPYENIKTNVRKGEAKTPEFLKMNPVGRVPVLQDGSVTLFESAAICCYLAEKFPEKHLIPKAGTVERGLFYQWMFFLTTELEQGLWSMGKHKFALPEEKRIPEMQKIGAWEFSELAKTLEKAVQGKEFLVEDTFSIADIFAVHTLLWAKGFEVPISKPLETYLNTHSQRPAFKKIFEMRTQN
jgi:glutathione S-transferase